MPSIVLIQWDLSAESASRGSEGDGCVCVCECVCASESEITFI